MQTLVKQIRTYLNISQTELAEQLNVTFTTVNRWENGRAVPNKLAQTQLYELCKTKSVPVHNMTLNRIADTANSIEFEEGRVLLYHGSKSGISGAIEPISRNHCDFGRGFYMGTEAVQALTLICDFEKSKLYIVTVDTKELSQLEVPADIDWAMLVALYRGKMDEIKDTPFYNKYRNMTNNIDLIIGSIADDRMFYVLDSFFNGTITDAALINSLSALQLGKQYVAVSQKACNAVRIEKEITISHLERLFIQEVSADNRTKGVSLANEICKKYRREGKFFDEILDEAKRLEVNE